MITKRMELAKVIRLKDQHDTFVLQYNVVIEEDGLQIADSTFTKLLTPDTDVNTIEDADVKQAVEFYWTPEKIEAFKESKKPLKK